MAGRPAIKHDNKAVKELFKHLECPAEVFYTYPKVEDIISGVSGLDYGGNTRNILKTIICKILMKADTISVDWIIDKFGYSRSHSIKYALAARIASKAIELQNFTIKPLDKYYEHSEYHVSDDVLAYDLEMLESFARAG